MGGWVQECGYTSGGQEDGEGGEILDSRWMNIRKGWVNIHRVDG